MSEIVTFDGKVTSTPDEEDQVAKLLVSVGDRVRNARARAGLSRRALSEQSGVSQRYLAQLEGGHGNVSIALLMRIANALDLQLEWLTAEDDPWDTELGSLKIMLNGATKTQRERVRAILDPDDPVHKRAERIAFIGLRGAGKSTLGRLTADAIGLPFHELNDEVEGASGMPVHEVIALYGQEGYRHLEYKALERIVATHDTLLLAVAGGIVSQPETFNYLLRHYHTIWLRAEPEDHMERVRGQGDERPMAGNPDAMAELRTMLKTRESIYARASTRVDTSKKSLEECLTSIISAIHDKGFLAGDT